MDIATQTWLDQEDAHVVEIIRTYGWFIQYVGGDLCSNPICDGESDGGPPFAYTVGLFGLGHPELLVFGLPQPLAGFVLNTLGERIRAGTNLIHGQLVTFDEWAHRIICEQVPDPGQIVYAANRHYQRPSEVSVPVLQLTYDDPARRFPWDSDYAAPEMQPRPGTYTT